MSIICLDSIYTFLKNTLTVLDYEFWAKKGYKLSPNGPDIYFYSDVQLIKIDRKSVV